MIKSLMSLISNWNGISVGVGCLLEFLNILLELYHGVDVFLKNC